MTAQKYLPLPYIYMGYFESLVIGHNHLILVAEFVFLGSRAVSLPQ